MSTSLVQLKYFLSVNLAKSTLSSDFLRFYFMLQGLYLGFSKLLFHRGLSLRFSKALVLSVIADNAVMSLFRNALNISNLIFSYCLNISLQSGLSDQNNWFILVCKFEYKNIHCSEYVVHF